MIFFTADIHGDHENILKYCNRPFRSISEMRRSIIERWNRVVDVNDEVYILGDLWLGHDFSSSEHMKKFLKKLNGEKHLILGNHDRMDAFAYIRVGIASVHTSLYVEGAYLCHDPAWSVAQDASQMVFCGHVHTLFKKAKNCVNVGVDVWDFTPVRFSEAKAVFESE